MLATDEHTLSSLLSILSSLYSTSVVLCIKWFKILARFFCLYVPISCILPIKLKTITWAIAFAVVYTVKKTFLYFFKEKILPSFPRTERVNSWCLCWESLWDFNKASNIRSSFSSAFSMAACCASMRLRMVLSASFPSRLALFLEGLTVLLVAGFVAYLEITGTLMTHLFVPWL